MKIFPSNYYSKYAKHLVYMFLYRKYSNINKLLLNNKHLLKIISIFNHAKIEYNNCQLYPLGNNIIQSIKHMKIIYRKINKNKSEWRDTIKCYK